MEGIIFKIKRKSKKKSLKKVEQLSGIDKTMISRFENQKLSLSEQQIDLLFSAIGEENCSNFEQKKSLLDYVLQMSLDFIQENEYKYSYQQYIAQGWNNFRSEEYFVYLIGLLIYGYDDKFAQNTLIISDLLNLLKEYQHYIPISFKSIFYCIDSLYKIKQADWDHSLDLLQKARSYAINDLIRAFTLYRLGKYHSYSCNLLEALDLLNQSKRIFDQHFYIRNALYCQIEIGYVYMKMGLYQKAEDIFVDCIQLNNKYSISLSAESDIYLLLSYMYLNMKCYEKINAICVHMINHQINEARAYTCLSILCYYQGDLKQAKHYLTVAQKYKNDYKTSSLNKMMIQAYRLVINGRDFREYEKKFLEIYQCGIDKNDIFLQIYVLEILVDFAKKENKTTELIKYYSILHDKLKERH